MKHLVAILICIALLVAMVGVFGIIFGSPYRDFVTGKPFDPATLSAMFSPTFVRYLLIALAVAAGFGILDIRAILSRKRDDADPGPKPNSRPLGFAAVRFRRYLLPVVMMAYIGLIARFLLDLRHSQIVADYAVYVFIFFFLLSRRGLNDSIHEVVDALVKIIGKSTDAFVQGRAS